MALRAVVKLSLSVPVKELCWAEGRLTVGYPYSIISLVQKYEEKDVNDPLILQKTIKQCTNLLKFNDGTGFFGGLIV